LRKKHVLHRNLRPSHILVSTSGEVKLADFGMSATLARSTEERNTTAGTLKYMSPERMKGKYSWPTDMWSFGILIYEGACGRFPIPAVPTEMWKLMELYEAGVEVNLPEGYSPQLKEFIEWCLMVDPVKRMKPEDTARSWAANFKEDECQMALTEWAQMTEGSAPGS
jgi:mitogen-activated protein kinase kinase 1